MQLLLTNTAPSNIGQGGDTIIQTQNCVSPCAWVKLIFSVSNCHLCAGATLSSRSIFQATRFVRVIPEQGAMSSSQGKKKRPEFVRVILVQAIPLYRSKKKLPISDLECHSCAGAMQQYPESHHLCAEAMQQCPEEETPSSLRRGHATVSSGR